MKSSTARRSIDVVGAVAVAALTFAYRYLSFERFPNDHFVHLSRAQQVLMGALPVRDYAEYQAPLAVMASAWGQVAFGPGLVSELFLVCGAFAIAAAVAYFVTTSISGSRTVGFTCALILTAATPVSYSYPKVLPYVLAFGAAWGYARKPSALRLWLLAAAVVFAGLLRHDHAVVLGAGATAAVFTAYRDRSQAMQAVLQLTMAGLVLALPYIVWVQRYEGIPNYIASNVDAGRIEAEKATWSAPRIELDPSRPLWVRMADPPERVVHVRWRQDLSEDARLRAEAAHGLRLVGTLEQNVGQYELVNVDAAAVLGLVRDPAVQETSGIDPHNGRLDDRRPLSGRVLQYLVMPGDGLRPALIVVMYYLSWLLPISAAVLLAAAWRDTSLPVRSIAAMAILVQLIMCREMLRDPLPTRVRDVVAPLVLLLALTTVLTRARGLSMGWSRKLALAAVFLVTGVAVAGAGSFGPNLRETGIGRGWSGITARTAEIHNRYTPPHERTGDNSSLGGIDDYVATCTKPQSRILALTFVSQLFFFTNRGFAGGYDALHSRFYSSDRQVSQILQRLSREDVPLVILDNETDISTMQTYPRLAAYVRERYHEVGRFDAGQGKAYIVLAENGRRPVASFGTGHLPCFMRPEETSLSRTK